MSKINGTPLNTPGLSNLDHLNDFALLAFFDHLDVGDLASMSELAPRYHDLIVRHYIIPIYRFNELEISIRTNEKGEIFINGQNPNKNDQIHHEVISNFHRKVINPYVNDDNHYTNNQKLKISDGFHQTLRIVKNFGHLMNHVKLVINDSDEYADIQAILTHITDHCPNATESIELHRTSPYNSHANISFPLAKKVAVWYNDDGESPGLDPLDLNVKFPKMEQLIAMTNWRLSLNHQFPHLTHLDVKEWWDADFTTFLQFNPQLRSFKAHISVDSIDLYELSEMLPNLESLDMKISCGFWIFKNQTVHFPNVKEFSLEIIDPWYAEPIVWIRDRLQFIVFDKLETLTLISNCHNLTESYIDWIVQHDKLKHLEIGGLSLNFEQFSRMITALPALTDITYGRYVEMQPDVLIVIGELLEKSGLDRIVAVTNEESRREFVEMVNFSTNWKVEKENIDGKHVFLTFERQ